MSIATKAATCAACGKRLNRKQWYYRNGQYFCKKPCWVSARKKAAAEAPTAEAPKAAAATGPSGQGSAGQPPNQPPASGTSAAP